MKRPQTVIVYLALICFISWNIITLLKNTEPAGNEVHASLGQESSLLQKVQDLERQVQAQVDVHNSLLQKLQWERQQIEKHILNINHKKLNRKITNGKGRPDIGEHLNGVNSSKIYIEKILFSDKEVVIPVLVIACNRVSVRKNLDQLIKIRPSASKFPIIVSQDCGHVPTAKVIQSYGSQVIHIQQPDLSEPQIPWSHRKWKGYYKISRHYKWALNQVFHKLKHTSVIIVEDDLDISPDFFEYFSALYPILKSDPTLWCISAWNDNGKENIIENNSELLYRTDFFPGLGWMLTNDLWNELGPKWPLTFWDDWLRHPDQRKGRSCIRPEISRTHTFGKIGVSKGQFFDKHLKFIKLNSKPVKFTKMDLSYLKKENFDKLFHEKVYSLPTVNWMDLKLNKVSGHTAVRIDYNDKKVFQTIAKSFGIMDDFKSGVPRTGVNGIVPFMFSGRRVYMAPPKDWTAYRKDWN